MQQQQKICLFDVNRYGTNREREVEVSRIKLDVKLISILNADIIFGEKDAERSASSKGSLRGGGVNLYYKIKFLDIPV